MSTARARANHKLYLARILLSSWREQLAREQIPSVTLNQAFSAPVREHLLQSYGWFLLEISHPDVLPDSPPVNCAGLPELPEGKAVPGEIREFEQLEQDGWIGDMLAGPDEWATGSRGSGAVTNLASPAPSLPDADALEQWADRLSALFDRMSDSLDEY